MYTHDIEWSDFLIKAHKEAEYNEAYKYLMTTDAQYIILEYINTPAWQGCLIRDRKRKDYISSGVKKWNVTQKRLDNMEIMTWFCNKDKFFKYWNKNINVKILDKI